MQTQGRPSTLVIVALTAAASGAIVFTFFRVYNGTARTQTVAGTPPAFVETYKRLEADLQSRKQEQQNPLAAASHGFLPGTVLVDGIAFAASVRAAGERAMSQGRQVRLCAATLRCPHLVESAMSILSCMPAGEDSDGVELRRGVNVLAGLRVRSVAELCFWLERRLSVNPPVADWFCGDRVFSLVLERCPVTHEEALAYVEAAVLARKSSLARCSVVVDSVQHVEYLLKAATEYLASSKNQQPYQSIAGSADKESEGTVVELGLLMRVDTSYRAAEASYLYYILHRFHSSSNNNNNSNGGRSATSLTRTLVDGAVRGLPLPPPVLRSPADAVRFRARVASMSLQQASHKETSSRAARSRVSFAFEGVILSDCSHTRASEEEEEEEEDCCWHARDRLQRLPSRGSLLGRVWAFLTYPVRLHKRFDKALRRRRLLEWYLFGVMPGSSGPDSSNAEGANFFVVLDESALMDESDNDDGGDGMAMCGLSCTPSTATTSPSAALSQLKGQSGSFFFKPECLLTGAAVLLGSQNVRINSSDSNAIPTLAPALYMTLSVDRHEYMRSSKRALPVSQLPGCRHGLLHVTPVFPSGLTIYAIKSTFTSIGGGTEGGICLTGAGASDLAVGSTVLYQARTYPSLIAELVSAFYIVEPTEQRQRLPSQLDNKDALEKMEIVAAATYRGASPLIVL